MQEVSIPSNMSELCDGCFLGCKSLRRVAFGSSSSLEVIGVSCFHWARVEEVRNPTVSVSCALGASVRARVFVV